MKYISKAYVFALLVTLNMPALSFPAFAQDVEFAWAAGMGGTGYDYGYGIAVDASGNVYTTGSFEGTADFDPGSGVSNLTSAGDNDVFVRKLDASGNFLWARSMGGTGSDRAWGIAVDASGSVYTTGYFRNTADFDPGAGVFNLTSAGSTGVFVQKLDTDGNFLWVKQMGGTSSDYGYAIAVDASGNVYTTGSFRDTVDFDPGSGVSNLTSAGDNDVFVSKLDASGNFLWARSMGGTGSDRGYGIAVDASGNIYTTGYFEGTADFDPGAGVSNLTSAGSTEIFVQKLDTSGNFAWAKAMGGTSTDYGYGIAVDASGNVYATGSFEGTADFDPGSGVSNLTSAGDNDVFVSKLDASGNFLWARSMGGTGSDRAWGIAVDASGSVYTTGYFRNTADFDPGAEVSNLTSAGDNDVFVSKLDASGNFLWARSMGGTGSDRGGGIAVDASGIVYTTGWFSSTVDFDPGAGTVNLTSAGARDIFVQKLSPPALDMPTATCFSFR